MDNYNQTKDLPIHFFTIVLNGNPFIQYHINVFKNLPFKWHWHIIEGVADLKNDTAWSLKNGAHISDELHNKGLSNDGTSDYIDSLQSQFPDNVTVYRKGGGQFWNGKLEMVNAPIPYINEECILWEIDSDELWTLEQLIQGRQLFLNNPEKTASYYFCYFFVGEDKFITSVNTYGNHTDFEWLRTWRYKPGDKWLSHEPPGLCRLNENGEWIDIGKVNSFSHNITQHHKLVFQHFAYVTPEQLKFKEQYYGYKNAVKQWEKLQSQNQFPLLLKNYFEWVNDETVVDNSKKYGIIPLAKKNSGNWKFNYYYEQKTQIKKILFVRTDSIGDCIIAASMLEPIKNKYTEAIIDVACQDKTSIIFDNSPFVSKVIDYNREKFKNDNSYRELYLSSLRKENYDLVLNSVYSREDITDIISLGSGAKKTIGLRGDSCNISLDQLKINNQFYNLLLSQLSGLTELQKHKLFLNEIGIEVGDLNPVLWHNNESEYFADEFFQRNNFKKETTIAFFPFAQHFHKEYPHYEDIIKNYPQFTFLIFGGNEKTNDDRLKVWTNYENCFNLVGKTSILQLSSLVKRCSLYIGADSAGVHVACANNIPNVVILGGGHFGRFLPYSNSTSAVVKPMDCYLCDWKCIHSNVKCVYDIESDILIKAIDKTMSEKSNKPRIFFKKDENQNSVFTKYINPADISIIEIPQEDQNRITGLDLKRSPNIIIKKDVPKISVVTPNYNQADYIEQTIQSVLQQGYPNLEYVIIDGGSTDGSIDIIKKYEKHLTFWKSEKDKGQYHAVNNGFNLVSGEIMTWINSDDLFHKDSFKKVADVFQNNGNVEWITGRPNNTDEFGVEISSYEYLPIYTREKFLKGLYWAPFIMQEGTFWRRSLWEKAGSKISTEFKLAADLELWVRFFRHSRLFTLNSYLGCFRVREGQRSSEQLIDYMAEAERVIEIENQSNIKTSYEEVNIPPKLFINSEPELKYNFGEVNNFFLTCYFLSSFQKKNRFDLSLEYFNRVKNFYKNDFNKDKYPQISIVITADNNYDLLERAIISVIIQSYPNLELIIVDRDNGNNNINRLKDYDEYIYKNIKISSSYLTDLVKTGFQNANGELIFWLNEDHFLEPGILLKIFKEYSKHYSNNGWMGRYRLIDGGTYEENILDSNDITLENISYNEYNNEIYLPFFIFKKEFVKQRMNIITDNNEIFDINFWINKIATENFLAVKDVLVNRFVNDKKQIDINVQKTEVKITEINKREIKVNNNEVEEAIERGDYTLAIKHLQDVINENPTDTEALNNLAVILSILGDNDSAVRALNLVLKVDPQNQVAIDNLKILAL